jgi:uncharacterized protein
MTELARLSQGPIPRSCLLRKSAINHDLFAGRRPALNLTMEANCLYSTYVYGRATVMKIPVDEIPQSPQELKFSETIEELNELYRRSGSPDFGFPSRLDVDLVYYRSGADIFFDGSFRGQFAGYCGRCLESYSFTLNQAFAFVLSPEPARSERGAEELHSAELGLSYYSGDEVDLAPLIAEQVMLALPTRPLCGEDCRGLCDHCGANRNRESCDCSTESGDPRMAIFRTLKVGR